MNNLFGENMTNLDTLYDGYFLAPRNLYLHCFNALPSICYINHIDEEKAIMAFKEEFKTLVKDVYQYGEYEKKAKKYRNERIVIILSNDCIIQFEKSYCEILHDNKQQDFVDAVTGLVKRFKERQRKQPLEINLIVQGSDGISLKAMEIKKTKLNLALFYEDDFLATDELIRKRLNQKNDKGIVLLHGLPGSGKTSYLRNLVSKIKKKVMFLSPSVAGNLMNPEFIHLLVENPNSVLIIEDAENIIIDRKHDSGSAVSNLLNISDGLLADFLNVQLICTFNSSLTLIDSALMRKGRLIAKYEFGRLSIEKSRRLSDYFGFKTVIHKPMTVAEIANQDEREFQASAKETIGFRTQLMEN